MSVAGWRRRQSNPTVLSSLMAMAAFPAAPPGLQAARNNRKSVENAGDHTTDAPKAELV
jgi:hypothetical protein